MDMSLLKKIFVGMGAREVRTYLRSGNVIFESGEKDTARLRRDIESSLLEKLGFSVKVLVKTGVELRRVVESMPFTDLDTDKLHVTFLSAVPRKFPSEAVDSAKAQGEEYALVGKEIYLYCPAGYGRTKLSNRCFEKKFSVDATTRNWRTVNAILKLVEGRSNSGRARGRDQS